MGIQLSKAWAAIALAAALLLTGCSDYLAAGWGSNLAGQLGTGTFESSSVPVAVDTSGVLGQKTVVQTSAGDWSSCSLATDGTAACWGMLPEESPPAPVPESIPMTGVLAGKVITEVSASPYGHCALTSDGMVGCWAESGAPVEHMTGALEGRSVVDIAGGIDAGCAVTAEGVLACWRQNWPHPLNPVQVNATGVLRGKTIIDIDLGYDQPGACALTADNIIACWDITAGSIPTPTLVDTTGVLAGKKLVDLGGGRGPFSATSHACVVTSEGTAACWGANYFGELGDGTTTNRLVPVLVRPEGALAGKRITAISAGYFHTCAVLADESAACWGSGGAGQLGDGNTQGSLLPVAVQALESATGDSRPLISLDAGTYVNMAVYRDVPESHFVAIAPERVLDTRRVGAGAPITNSINFGVQAVVPPGATAVTYNLVVTGQTASGVATVTPESSATSALQSSVLNWTMPQQTIANGHVVQLNADRQLKVSMASAGSAHFVMDITGYFMPSGDPAGALFTPTNERLYDSRINGGPLGPGESRAVESAVMNSHSTPLTDRSSATVNAPNSAVGSTGVADAIPTAAAVNVTATGTTGSGVLTVAKEASKATSTVNWSAAGQTIANAVVTDIAPDGRFTVTNNGLTPVDVVVDLTGRFVPADAGVGAAFYPTEPTRTYDSRPSGESLAANQSRVTTLPVPADAVAVALNATITGTTGTGFLSVTAPTTAAPKTSTVNWFDSPTTRANGSFVSVERKASQASTGGLFATEYVYDMAGYFR